MLVIQKRDEIGLNRHRALGLCLSMIPAQTLRVCRRENRCTLFRIMLQVAKLFQSGWKLRGLYLPSRRSALRRVADKLDFVRLVNRHGTAPCSHGLKGQRATFLLAVLRLAIAMPSQDPRFTMRAVGSHCILQCSA